MTRRLALLAAAGLTLAACGGGDEGSDSGRAEADTAGAAESAPPVAHASGPCTRPYRGSSPWNTPIPRGAVRDRRESAYIDSLGDSFTSDPSQYTYPVYEVPGDAPRVRVRFSGYFSNVTHGGRRLDFIDEPELRIPIPEGAEAAEGSDAQIIVIDRSTGDEWGLWHAERTDDGGWEAENGYHYDVDWDGVPPLSDNGNPFGSRGAGVPYLAGLVRPCEIARGRIDHALAFAYDYPSDRYVFPATKSDGDGSTDTDLPEGSRLQLDPRLSDDAIRKWGCSGPCLVIARALQRYGMYVIDNAGRPKVMLEYEGTARWNGAVDDETVSPIPFSAFRVIAPCTRVGSPRPDALKGTRRRDVICAREGADQVGALGGNDVVYAGWGDDRVEGGRGADVLFGERGRDTLIGGPGRDTRRP